VDLTKLITVGKIQKTVSFKTNEGDIEVVLTTPAVSRLQDEDPYKVVASFMTETSDPKTLDALRSLQPAVFAKLVETCAELSTEQGALIEGLVSKK